MADVQEIIGRVLSDGRYEITEHIGTGSMGHVYKAIDHRLDTVVCIKVPTTSRLEDPDFYRRFELESQFLVKLAHPQVVRIIDVGKEDKIPYIVMQFVGGGSLLERMIDANGQPHPRPMKGLKHWLPAVAKALDFMHKQGCIHRDVKPANILFDDHNNAFLSDFGLSKILLEDDEPAAEANRMTAKGAVVGTPNYVAPEIVLAHQYNGKADQYSLATTVYEFLTGRAPLEGPSASATMVNQTTKQPPPLSQFVPNISPALNAAVLKALAKKHENRYVSCEDFSDAVMGAVLSHGQHGSSISGHGTVTGGSSMVAPRVPKFIIGKVSKAVAPGKIPCPRCEKNLILNSEYAGLIATCSGCQARLKISADVCELGLLQKNPSYRSDIHAAADADQDSEVSTILKAEAFGMQLSEKQALSFIGIALVIIVVGAIAFSQGLLTPSQKQLTVSTIRTTSREDNAVRVKEAPKVPVSIALISDELTSGWLESGIKAFENSPAGSGIQILQIRPASQNDHIHGVKEAISSGQQSGLPAILSPQDRLESIIWNSSDKTSLIAVEETLYYSPLVCLMWQNRYFEFKKKYPEISIPNLLDASIKQADWNNLAKKSEWGLFRFAMPRYDDPSIGRLLKLMTVHQMLETSAPIQVSDLNNPEIRTAFSQIDHVAVRPERGSEQQETDLLNQALSRGPDFCDVLILTEQAALKTLPALEEKWGFVQVTYLNPAPQFQKTLAVNSFASAEQQKAASVILGHMRSSEVERQLLDLALRPSNTDINIMTGSSPFARYSLRGVQAIPPVSVELPTGDVLKLLDDLYDRWKLDNQNNS